MKNLLITITIILTLLSGDIFAQNSKTNFCNQLNELIEHSSINFKEIRGATMASGQRKIKRYATEFWFAKGGFPYIEYKENSWYYLSQYFSTPEIEKGYVQLERLKRSIKSCLGDKWKMNAYEKAGLTDKYTFEKGDLDPKISVYIVDDGKYATIYFEVKIT